MLVTLALALSASPQYSVRSEAFFDVPAFSTVEVRSIARYPDGGVVVNGGLAVGATPGQPTEGGFVARVSGDGRPLWLTAIPFDPAPLGLSSGEPTAIGVLGDGAVAAAYSAAPLDSSCLVRVFEPDGALRWEREFTAPGAFPLAKVGDIGAAGATDVLLHIEWRGAAVGNSGLAVSMRLDGDTAADVWRQERAIDAGVGFPVAVRAEVRDDALYFATRRPDLSYEATKLDADGAEQYVTAGVLPNAASGGQDQVALIDVGPDGSVALGSLSDMTLLDPSGSIAASLATDSPRSLRWGPAGDVLLLRNGRVEAFDASGQQRWVRALNSPTSAIPTLDGGAVVWRVPTSANGLVFQAELDDAGLVTGSVNLTVENQRSGAFAPTNVDADGSYWMAVSYRQMAPEDAFVRILHLSVDSAIETSVCAQTEPNSTGDLGRLALVGDGAASVNDVVLFADRLPPGQSVLFLNSRDQGFTADVGGSLGSLCLGGTVNRYVGPGEIQTSGPLGSAWLRLSLPNTPDGSTTSPVLAGETWYHQAWHRDVVGGTQTSNLTSAVAITYR